MTTRPRQLACVLALATLAACTTPEPGRAEAEAGGAKPAANTPAEPADILALGEAKIMREGHEDRAFVLAADGTITLAGMPFGSVTSDGQLRDPAGAVMMRATADGHVVSEGGESTGIVLDATGGKLNLSSLRVDVRFAGDGSVVIDASGPNAALLGADSPKMLSRGCTGPVTRTCALITLSYLMALGNPDSGREVEADE